MQSRGGRPNRSVLHNHNYSNNHKTTTTKTTPTPTTTPTITTTHGDKNKTRQAKTIPVTAINLKNLSRGTKERPDFCKQNTHTLSELFKTLKYRKF